MRFDNPNGSDSEGNSTGATKCPVYGILRTVGRLNDFNELPFRDDTLQFGYQFDVYSCVPSFPNTASLLSANRISSSAASRRAGSPLLGR